MDVRVNLGFLLYLDRCSFLFQHFSLSYCYRDPAGILWDFSMKTLLFSVYLWMASAEKFQINRGKCLNNSSKAPPLFKWLFLAAVSQLWHIKASSWCGRTCIPKSASVTKGDLQWQVSYLTVSFSWMAWLIKFNVEQELAYILPGLRCSYSHLT